MNSINDRHSPVNILGFPHPLEANSWNMYSPGKFEWANLMGP